MDTLVPRVAKYSRPVHILVVGAGAVGCFYGSRLHSPESNVFVSLVCRSNYDAIVQNGGSVSMQTRNFGDYTFTPTAVYPSIKAAVQAGRAAAAGAATTNSSSPARKQQGWDYIFVTTKALPDVTDDARDIEPLVRLAPEGRTCIVLVQNGVGIEEPHRRRFPLNPIVTAVTVVNAEQTSPGVVRQNRWTRISMGPYSDGLGGKTATARTLADRGTAATRQLVTLFAEPGKLRDAEEHDEVGILLVRWHKICINAAMNPSAVLSGGLPSADMVLDTELRTHLRGVMEEVFDAAPAILGRSFPPNLASPERILRSTERNTGGRPSMLVDWQTGRPLELEVILGNPVRIARRHGVDMQRTQTMYALLKSAQMVRDSLAAEHKGKSALVGLGQGPAPARAVVPAGSAAAVAKSVSPAVAAAAAVPVTGLVSVPAQVGGPHNRDSAAARTKSKKRAERVRSPERLSPPPSPVAERGEKDGQRSAKSKVSAVSNTPAPSPAPSSSHSSPTTPVPTPPRSSSSSPPPAKQKQTPKRLDRLPKLRMSSETQDEPISQLSAIDKLESDLRRARKQGFDVVETHQRSFDKVVDEDEEGGGVVDVAALVEEEQDREREREISVAEEEDGDVDRTVVNLQTAAVGGDAEVESVEDAAGESESESEHRPEDGSHRDRHAGSAPKPESEDETLALRARDPDRAGGDFGDGARERPNPVVTGDVGDEIDAEVVNGDGGDGDDDGGDGDEEDDGEAAQVAVFEHDRAPGTRDADVHSGEALGPDSGSVSGSGSGPGSGSGSETKGVRTGDPASDAALLEPEGGGGGVNTETETGAGTRTRTDDAESSSPHEQSGRSSHEDSLPRSGSPSGTKSGVETETEAETEAETGEEVERDSQDGPASWARLKSYPTDGADHAEDGDGAEDDDILVAEAADRSNPCAEDVITADGDGTGSGGGGGGRGGKMRARRAARADRTGGAGRSAGGVGLLGGDGGIPRRGAGAGDAVGEKGRGTERKYVVKSRL